MFRRYRPIAALAIASVVVITTSLFSDRTNAAVDSASASHFAALSGTSAGAPQSDGGALASAFNIPYANGDAPTGDDKRYIVRYRDDASATAIATERGKRGAKQKRPLSRVFNGDILDLSPGQAALMLKNTSLVLWVEEDKVV